MTHIQPAANDDDADDVADNTNNQNNAEIITARDVTVVPIVQKLIAQTQCIQHSPVAVAALCIIYSTR